MPSFISHAIIGYLLFKEKGAMYGLLPDVIGFSEYFLKTGLVKSNYTFKNLKKWGDIFPVSKMSKSDWSLYNISHSLVLWFVIYYITGDKSVYAAIFAIIMDIFLHSNAVWKGPTFMYPLSDYRYDGIHWLSPTGMLITISVIAVLLLLPEETIQRFIEILP